MDNFHHSRLFLVFSETIEYMLRRNGRGLGRDLMRYYFVDEIAREDIERIRDFLDKNANSSSIKDLYWVHLTEGLLDETQHDHKDCWPYCFAVELGENFVKFEFLIRSRNSYRCSCSGYAAPAQRDFIINFAEGLVERLAIRT